MPTSSSGKGERKERGRLLGGGDDELRAEVLSDRLPRTS